MKGAAKVFLTLSADGVEDDRQRSRVRQAFMLGASLLVLLSAPLFWAVTAQGSGADAPDAVLNKPNATASGVDDDDDDDTGDDDSGDGGESGDGTGGDGRDTRGDTGAASDRASGRETGGNTDRLDLNTGKSTRGETDGRDNTGKTERTQGTGRESLGKTDAPGNQTGKSTRGESDPGDNTGKTERR